MPAPVSHDTRCSDCGLPWSMHAADDAGAVASTECVRLLLVENERLRTAVPVGFPPQPWPVYVSNPYDAIRVSPAADATTMSRMSLRPLEAPSDD